MTLEDVLPAPDWAEHHTRVVVATPEAGLAATRAVTLDDMPLGRLLLRARGLHGPARTA